MLSTGIQLAASAYLLWIAVKMETKNEISAVIFKYTPSTLGVLIMLSAFKVI